MCSVDDCTDSIDAEKKHSDICCKCKLNKDVLRIRTDEVFCSSCFLTRATHKFRSEFGKSRLVRDKEKLLVAYSGGRASSAMIHLIEQGLSKRAQKKLRFCPSLLFIDDGYLLLPEDRRCRLDKIVKKMQAVEMTFYIYSLEQSIEDASLQPLLTSSDTDISTSLHGLMFGNNNSLLLLLQSVRTHSSRTALFSILRKRLLLKAARYLHYDKVAVCDTSSDLAARVMSFIAQGRGAQLPYETSFADTQHEGVILLRPMREFSAVEVDAYNRINSIEPVVMPDEETLNASIDSLSERFVSCLQSQQDTTVSTVCRTAEKLEMCSNLSAQKTFCSLCLATCNLESQCEESEADHLDSVHSSALNEPSFQSRLTTTAEMHCSATSGTMTEEIISQLCYSCRRIAEDMAIFPLFLQRLQSIVV